MKKSNYNWLSHLEGSIPKEVHGYTLSMYSIALEGWRRGLTLKFINSNRSKAHTVYTLTYKEKTHHFTVSRGDIVPREAIKTCINKYMTKEYLKKAKVPTPEGKIFNKADSDDEIVTYAEALGYPLVIKPSDGTGGHGVIANIKTSTELREALLYVRDDLKYSEVIVEKFFAGLDYRVYVIGDEVIGAVKRIPANIIGDGINSVKNLLKLKMEERNTNPALFNRPIKIDREMHSMLRSKGYTLDSVPQKDERVFLRSKNNVSVGGDPIDATDELTDEIKNIAINAAKAVPGLVQCGIDIMVDKEKNIGVVLEINSRPSIRSHIYPMEGQARDIPKAIVDYYFPETTSNYDQPSYYFDFQSIFQTFQSGIAKEYTVPDVPKGDLLATRFIVSGNLRGVNYERWVQKQARDLNLHGYIKHLRNDTTSIVVSGPTESIKKFRDIIKTKSSKRATIKEVIEKSRESPVKVGFAIIRSESNKNLVNKEKTVQQRGSKDVSHSTRLKEFPQERSKRKGNKDYSNLQKERDYYKKKYKDIKSSRVWRVTKPIRKAGRFIRSILNK